MARKPNKHDISLSLAISGTDGDDYLQSFQGADTLTGGAGADTFQIHSWASSNAGADFGQDTITDFEAIDFIDIANLTHLSDVDILLAVYRPVEWGDITFTPIEGGNHMHIEIVAGETRWAVDMDILGATPIEANFIFA
jgi:hemolysin type calcium-binding protein